MPSRMLKHRKYVISTCNKNPGLVAIFHVVQFFSSGEEMLSVNDVLSRLFDEDTDCSGSDSGGEEGTDIYAYRGSSLDPKALRDEARLEGFLDCKFSNLRAM